MKRNTKTLERFLFPVQMEHRKDVKKIVHGDANKSLLYLVLFVCFYFLIRRHKINILYTQKNGLIQFYRVQQYV